MVDERPLLHEVVADVLSTPLVTFVEV